MSKVGTLIYAIIMLGLTAGFYYTLFLRKGNK
jgi:hypothetical protein